MPAGQAEEVLALSIVFVVHVVGAIMLVWGILGDEGSRRPWWRWWGGGGGDGDPPRDPGPPDGGQRAPLPLGAASPSRVRLREDGRLADGYPRAPRRPGHPEPVVPAHTPGRDQL